MVLLLSLPVVAVGTGRRAAAGRVANLAVNVSPVTAQRYRVAYLSFVRWLAIQSLPHIDVLADGRPSVFVEVLIAFLQTLYAEGRPISSGTYILCAIQYFHRHLHGQLRGAWQSVRTWRVSEPGELRRPIPLALARALAVAAAARGWWALACGILLAFHCLLRPGELVALRRAQLRLPGDAVWGVTCGVVTILKPKNRRTAARVQHVTITCPGLLRFLALVFGALPPSSFLLRLTTSELHGQFQILLGDVRLFGSQFTPAGLRAGGATSEYLAYQSVDRLQYRGRWDSLNSLKHYIQEATCALALMELTSESAYIISTLDLIADEILPPSLEFFLHV